MKWEYNIVSGHISFNLNNLGKNGWELIAVTDTHFYFKRPNQKKCRYCSNDMADHKEKYCNDKCQ